MTDKEIIRKEVERLMTELIQEKEKGFGSDIDDACILELQNVLTFIDSLQEEPVSKNLEKAAKDFSNSLDNICSSIGEQTRNAFKAGAKWQKQQTIDKAAEWLKCAGKYHWYDPIEHNEGFGTDRLIEDFKKYMEDKQ